ncbi:MAG: FxsA family protein [Paracoccus sp. (in: a-proteobacteria)]|nr:FxsA family protein [Paracoccus sp. (in: a-proteobacteria)]
MPLLILMILIPVIEIALFIQIGGVIGVWPTIALVLLSAAAGIALIRSAGRRSMIELQQSFQTLGDPARPLAHGAFRMLAGALLIVPGFLTDAVGLALLIPGVREGLLRLIGRRATVTRSAGFGFDSASQPRHGWPGRDDQLIDGDYVVQEDPYTSRDDIDLPEDGKPKSRGRGPNPSGWTRPD